MFFGHYAVFSEVFPNGRASLILRETNEKGKHLVSVVSYEEGDLFTSG